METASLAAKEFIDTFKKERKLGSFKKPETTIVVKKRSKKPLLFLLFPIIATIFIFLPSKYCKVDGYSNHQKIDIEFHNIESGKSYETFSSNGEFKLLLEKGTYKICSQNKSIQEEYKKPETTPLNVRIISNKTIRISWMPKK